MGKSAYHLAQRSKPFLLHHSGLAVLQLLHAFFQLGHILENCHKAGKDFPDIQGCHIHHVIIFPGALSEINGDRLFVGDGGAAFLAGGNGCEQVVDCRLFIDILFFHTVAQIPAFRNAVA